MPKKKIEHFKFISVSSDKFTTETPNVRVVVKVEAYLNDGVERQLAEFWIPKSSLEKIGNAVFIPVDIVKSRCKHLGFTFDHYSMTHL